MGNKIKLKLYIRTLIIFFFIVTFMHFVFSATEKMSYNGEDKYYEIKEITIICSHTNVSRKNRKLNCTNLKVENDGIIVKEYSIPTTKRSMKKHRKRFGKGKYSKFSYREFHLDNPPRMLGNETYDILSKLYELDLPALRDHYENKLPESSDGPGTIEILFSGKDGSTFAKRVVVENFPNIIQCGENEKRILKEYDKELRNIYRLNVLVSGAELGLILVTEQPGINSRSSWSTFENNKKVVKRGKIDVLIDKLRKIHESNLHKGIREDAERAMNLLNVVGNNASEE